MSKLLKLPEIRNDVFFPDYEKYGYLPDEPKYHEFGPMSNLSRSLNVHLSSRKANRQIALSYIFMNNNFELGAFNDNINILDMEKGWSMTVYISLLAKNRNYNLPNKSYKIPEIYSGGAEEKIEACLQQIKINYDSFATDIISGEYWDKDAWNIGGYF